MPTYTFTSQNVLTSDINAHEPHGISYRTATTTRTFGDNKATTLATLGSYVNEKPTQTLASINWKDSHFEIAGVQRKWSTLRNKVGGVFSSVREWHWSDNSYTVKYDHGKWTVISTRPSESVCATFSSYKIHLRNQSAPELAVMWLSSNIPYEDRTFIMLVLVYSEAKRQQDKQEATNAVVGGVVGSVITAITAS
ncbi:hypothetical protein H0H92_011191 [Tricholoma furcatifolium]|nr:hypothetical protein H0H92_011191 [Tricholoma furcatifolium]